jgi:hypothetical protein
MTKSTIRQSIVRLAAVVAIAAGLVLSSGLTAAAPLEIGLTNCSPSACTVITIDELKAAQAERALTVYRPTLATADRFSPHLTP